MPNGVVDILVTDEAEATVIAKKYLLWTKEISSQAINVLSVISIHQLPLILGPFMTYLSWSRYLGYFQGRVSHWEVPDQRKLRHIVPESRTKMYQLHVMQMTSRLFDLPLLLVVTCVCPE